jgi:hypothetical protein
VREQRVAIALAALVGVALALPAAPSAARSPFLPTPPLGPPKQDVFYGHATALVRRGGHWELRVDPAEFLTGLTATRAAVADGAIEPGDAVPNDYYVRDEGHRLLTFRVHASARITVITVGLVATRISVAELARDLAGRKTPHTLFEPKAGFWIHVAGDTVQGMDQQYQP